MTEARQWPAELTRATGRAIRHYRNRRGMSAEQLAEAVSNLGLRYTRTQVSNLESGRRDSISVGEVIAFAAVLEIPPALLLFPIGTDDEVAILPGQATDPWTAYRCFVGDLVLTRAKGSPGDPSRQELAARHPLYVTKLPDHHNPIVIYRQHATALGDWLAATTREEFHEIERGTPGYTPRDPDPVTAAVVERHLTSLAASRIEMHRHGWKLPPIPPDAAEAIRGPLLAWGYRQNEAGELIDARDVAEHPVGPERES